MSEEQFDLTKNAVLGHLQTLFEEIEESMAMKHQEKYSLLEDAFENATDVSELRVAFEQWFLEHAEDLELEDEADEMWELALSNLADADEDDDYLDDDDDDEDDEDDDEDDL